MERPTSSRASPTSRLIELSRVGGFHHRYEWSDAASTKREPLFARHKELDHFSEPAASVPPVILSITTPCEGTLAV